MKAERRTQAVPEEEEEEDEPGGEEGQQQLVRRIFSVGGTLDPHKGLDIISRAALAFLQRHLGRAASATAGTSGVVARQLPILCPPLPQLVGPYRSEVSSARGSNWGPVPSSLLAQKRNEERWEEPWCCCGRSIVPSELP
ncbi:hypothetical protein Anapl_14134 [Anas platyrhynchos]|uniref:Uncharacterized protein n=1 Tax=Anas platyrhynchos TaxID=8839 RepID=R0JTC7_ANAPL|nr:hypothetical protein Anapl_14134 [Anas platyrhynchos]